jgi:hypothetical protein
MDAVSVALLIAPGKPGGTMLWASEKVLSLVSGDTGGLDKTQRGLLRKRLQRYCDDGMRVFMPETVKREHGKTFGIHVGHFRIVGFFDRGYQDFIAIDWFVKKTQQNDKRMNAIYEKTDRIRESGQWHRINENE